jgi:ABC-type uncharacterized transport system substrate-binding protein
MSTFAHTRTALAVFAALALSTTRAVAHPHVSVTHTATVVFDKGAIIAIDHVWYFDEFYSAMAVEGLDTNKDGKYSREELADLAKTNADGLKDFDYFTFPTLAGQALKVKEPSTQWSEFKDGKVSLHFRLPLEQPVATTTKGFQFSVYDPSYFISFDFAKTQPVTLDDNAPKTCKVDVSVPKQEADQAKKLGESFFDQLGGGNYGLGVAKTVSVSCG